MIGDPLAAKRRVDEALEALRAGLTPYVSQRMRHAFGDRWQIRVTRAAGGDRDFTLDVYALLKTILDNWNDVFRAEAKLRKALSFVHLALDARNKAAHFSGSLEAKEALRFLDAIHEVLRAVEAPPQEHVVLKLYGDQQAAVGPLTPVPNQLDGAHASAAGSPSPVAFRRPLARPITDPPVASLQSQADRVRQFALDHYVTPARRAGLSDVTVRAGDVHRDMRLANALPAVCSAIGGNRFAQMANVRLAERTGPANGSNVFFRFTLNDQPSDRQPPSVPPTAGTPRPLLKTAPPAKTSALDLEGALVLISCVKSKLARPAPARLLSRRHGSEASAMLLKRMVHLGFFFRRFMGWSHRMRRLLPTNTLSTLSELPKGRLGRTKCSKGFFPKRPVFIAL